MKKVLIVNPFGIGDVLFTTPIIAALKASPQVEQIGYLCNRRTEELLRANPNIDEVFVFEKDEYRELWGRSVFACMKKFLSFLGRIKSKKFDVALDLSLNTKFGFFLWLVGIRRRIGYDYKERGGFLTEKIKLASYCDRHIVDYYKGLLKYLGVQASEAGPKVFLKDRNVARCDEFLNAHRIAATATLAAIIPGGGASWGKDAIYKRWHTDGFAQVADYLVERYNAKILIFGDKSERTTCQALADAMKHKPILSCGELGILDIAAVLKRCAVVLANDGGPLHVAVGVGAKTVSIFGPVDERVYGPYGSVKEHLVVKSGAPCRPCYKDFKFEKCEALQCLRSIRADEVIEAVDKLMR